jgi:hypothetical protein
VPTTRRRWGRRPVRAAECGGRRGRWTRLALIPVGYAPPPLPLVGTVSTDQCAIDVGDLDVRVDETVTLFGGDHGEPTVAEWSTWAGTIPPEIVTGIGRRVVRATGPALPRKDRLA